MPPTRRPTDRATIADVPRSNYTPPDDAAEVFAEYAHAKEVLADEERLRTFAVREMRNGATIGDLARLTKHTPEYFRRIARAEGIERRRPPTVRRINNDDPES